MGVFWVWFEIIAAVAVLLLPLFVIGVCVLRRASTKVDSIIAEELAPSPENVAPPASLPPTRSGESTDRERGSV
jgi:hypothetical protein